MPYAYLINHGHEPDRSGSKEAAGKNRFLQEDQHIHGVVVLAKRSRNEAVVVRVHQRRVQHAVDLTARARISCSAVGMTTVLTIVTELSDLDEPGSLVELVLDLAPFRDLHDLPQRSEEENKMKPCCDRIST